MLSPPGDPFVTNTEREIIILLCVLIAWGSVHKHIGCSRLRNQALLSHRWASLGIKLASLARSHTVYTATLNEIFSGKYIEAAVSSIWPPNLPFNSCRSLLSSMPFLFSSVLHSFYTSRHSKAPVRSHLQPSLLAFA